MSVECFLAIILALGVLSFFVPWEQWMGMGGGLD